MLRRALGLGVCWLVACGPRVDGDAESSSSGDGPSSSSTSSASSSESTADASSGSGGSDSTGDVATCESFADDLDGFTPTTIAFVNARDTPILLPNPCGIDFMTMTSALGGWPRPWCTDTCANAFEYGCVQCDGCPPAGYILIEPGGQYVLDWGGELYEIAWPPSECYSQPPCTRSCPVQVAPTAETSIDLEVIGTTLADCLAANGDLPEKCTCEANEDGWCEFYTDVPAEITLGTTVQFSPGMPVVVML